MSEQQPLLAGRRHSAFSASLSSSLPLSSPYLPLSYSAAPANSSHYASATPPAHSHSPYYQQAAVSMPQSPNPTRRPLDRIHHLPPPHLSHANSLPIPNALLSISSSASSGTSTPHTAASPSRLSSLLSLSSITSSPSSSSTAPQESKRVEVVPDRLGKPSVREEREWPKPKKDAQYDDDALLDYHSLLLLFVLLVTSIVLYIFFPAAVIWSNPAYVWTTFLLSLLVVYQIALFIEMSLLKLLSLASGSRVWKVYFYSQALHETLGNVLTILYVMWCRYYCTFIIFPMDVKQYLDPVLKFALLLFIAVLIRQIVTKHLTYIVNQERYAKAVQDLLFKGHVLARLCDPWAYQPLYTRPPVSAEVSKEYEVPFPYTPLPSKRKYPVFLSSSSSSSASSASSASSRTHPLYDIFLRLRDFNESLNDDYLPGGTGVSFFSSEKVARLKSKELFRNVDRERKGYLDIHDFRAYFPKETALRALKLFFPPSAFKASGKKTAGGRAGKKDLGAAPPAPFMLPSDKEGGAGGEGGAGEGAGEGVEGTKKKTKKKEKGLTKEKDKDKKKVVSKVKKAAVAAAAAGGSESKEQSDTESAPPSQPISRKPSATILETLVADNKEAAASIAQASVVDADTPSTAHSPALAPIAAPPTGDFSSISSTNLPASLAPSQSEEDLSIGQVVVNAQSAQEQHLQSLHLSYSALEARILGFHESRQTLSRQLRDLDGLADVMQSLSQLLFWVIVGLLLIVVFDEHIQSVMFSLSTILLSFTFVFATTIKDIFQAIILIFATKPYSVGDRVNIGKDKFRVHSIQLLTTTFRDLQNKISIVPNNKLSTLPIQNLTRSSNVVVKMKIAVAFDTPSAKLAQLRQRIVDHVQALPLQWKPAVSMHLADLAPQLNTVNVSLLISHLASYTQVKEWKRSKTELLHVVREQMIALGIAWKQPESSVSLVNGDSMRELMEGAAHFIDGYQTKRAATAAVVGEDKVKLIEDGTAEKESAVVTTVGKVHAEAVSVGAANGAAA